jgi:hypothetical protein
MPQKTVRRSRSISLKRLGDDPRVIVERTNEGMLVQKRQLLLLETRAFEQLADRSQPERRMRKGGFTGFFQGF